MQYETFSPTTQYAMTCEFESEEEDDEYVQENTTHMNKPPTRRPQRHKDVKQIKPSRFYAQKEAECINAQKKKKTK